MPVQVTCNNYACKFNDNHSCNKEDYITITRRGCISGPIRDTIADLQSKLDKLGDPEFVIADLKQKLSDANDIIGALRGDIALEKYNHNIFVDTSIAAIRHFRDGKEKAEAELSTNADMLAKQHDRNMELETELLKAQAQVKRLGTRDELDEQSILDEYSQAEKRGGEEYAKAYISGLRDGAKHYITPACGEGRE